MKKNMSKADGWIRVFIVAALVVLYAMHVISGTTGIIILAVGVVLLLTSLFSFCPIYRILGLSSRKKHVTGKM